MSIAAEIQEAIEEVHDQESFIQRLLVETLDWDIDPDTTQIEDTAYDYTSDELNSPLLDEKCNGRALRVAFQRQAPWGVFLIEFAHEDPFVLSRGLTMPLRQLLNALVPKQRRDSDLPSWGREDLLFICTYDYRHFRFAYFQAPPGKEKTAPLKLFGWNEGDTAIRTLCEHNLPHLHWDNDENWAEAFDIEKVTRDFYREYARVFEGVEHTIGEYNDISGDDLRLFTQTLFNRLMFLRFIEKKRWLRFNGDTDYLAALYAAGSTNGMSFYCSRLQPLFFEALAIEGKQKSTTVGEVVFLNGGLFEETELDHTVTDIPDEAFEDIFGRDGLFYRFNFTVQESTPLEIEVAVDPEMLGKVFEELVTGRHETGSYYTPRSVVAFMCREVLKGFLAAKTSASREAIVKLVDEREVSQDLTDRHADEIRFFLDTIKAVDPACGSGAYLLGLLQELIGIRRTLQNPRLLADPNFLYGLKLRLISQCLYGVDIDPFATNIAKLRLWLSLAVEAETAQPLPNLDFRIETGDSVLGPCDPLAERDDALIMTTLRKRAEQLVLKKDRFMVAHGEEKAGLFEEIRSEEAALAKEASTVVGAGNIAWHIHFAEVFATGRRQRSLEQGIFDSDIFKVVACEPGGFDVVLANPPYVNMVQMDSTSNEYREALRSLFSTARGGFDLFVPFMERGLQLAARDGMFAYIVPNKLLSAEYSATLREHFARHARLISLTDLSRVPVFNASVYPVIVLAQKSTPDVNTIRVEAYRGDAKSLDSVSLIKVGDVPFSTAVRAQGRWSPLLGGNGGPDIGSIVARCQTLGEVAEVSGACTVSEAYEWKKAVIDNGGKLLAQRSKRYALFLVSGNVRRFYHTWRADTVQYIKHAYHLPVLDKEHSVVSSRRVRQVEASKIIVSGMSKRPTCVWDPGGIAAGKSTVIVIPTSPEDGPFLTAVLNSATMLDIYKFLFGALSLSGGYLRFGPPQIKALPIPPAPGKERSAIAALAERCSAAKGVGCEVWEKEIDERVAALFGL